MLNDLKHEEHEILMELLARELADLGPEIRHTDDRDFREQLRKRRETVRGLLQRVEAMQPVA